MAIHPAIQEELNMLKERFPGKQELTLDDYAEYFGINRQYAPKHFHRKNQGINKIGHKRIGRKTIIIPMVDFAFWLAQNKIVDGHYLILDMDYDLEMKRRRGFSYEPKYNYRKLG